MKTVINFFKNVILEIKLTEWPDFKTISRYTGIVLTGIIVFTLLVASLDFLLFKLRDFILTK